VAQHDVLHLRGHVRAVGCQSPHLHEIARAENTGRVGRSTALIWLNADGQHKSMGYESTDKIRRVWNETLKTPEPAEAIEIITNLTTGKKK
jgi:hypothetical protein